MTSRVSLFYGLLIGLLITSIFSIAFSTIPLSLASTNSDVIVTTDEIIYEAEDDVLISGELDSVEEDVTQVKIVITDPNGGTKSITETRYDTDKFDHDYQLPSTSDEGRYTVKVTYNGDTAFTFFNVRDSDTDPVSVKTNTDAYSSGDRVKITGKIDNVESGEDKVELSIIGPDNAEIDTVTADLTDDTYTYNYDLENNADVGRYAVEATYNGDEGVAVFEVTDDSSSNDDGSNNNDNGSTDNGGSSSSSSSFTAKLNKSSYLAGEVMTITGKVPKIITDETVNVNVYKPDKSIILGLVTYIEPKSDLTYSGQIRIDPKLEVSTDYEVKATYNNEEVDISFAITGQASGNDATGPLTATTDKQSYNAGDTIKISGKVAADQLKEGSNILIEVKNPMGEPYRIDIITPSGDGSYSYPLVIGGKLGINGKYDVTVTYGQNKAKSSFQFGPQENKTYYPLKVGGNNYPIQYSISSGAAIKGMIVKASENKLVISINADQDGKLSLVLPRSVIDSIEIADGKDKSYFVAASDFDSGSESENVDIKESVATGDARTVEIAYTKGTDVIEIAGTSVVPEFGATAGLILAIAVVGIIISVARFRGKDGNRFLNLTRS